MTASANSRVTVRAICISLVCLTWLVFGKTVRFDFVNCDDDTYVTENPLISRGISSEGIAKAFSSTHSSNWHPLTTLSHMLDCQVFGLNPAGHHFINVLLHSIAVVLLFLVCRKMTGWLWGSAFIAAVFAIHPLRAESVAWVSERKDVLSAVFFMLTLLAYIRYTKRPSVLSYFATLIAFLLGLMSKPMLVTIPFVLLLLDYWPFERFENHRLNIRLFLEKLPLLGLSAGAATLTLWAQKQAVVSLEALPLSSRISNGLVACLIYIKQLLWPAGLAVFYSYPEKGSPKWEVVLATAVLLLVSAGAIAWRKKYPFLMTGWFWYLVMLLPVIGVIQVGSQAHADRYTYLPQIGLLLIVAGAATSMAKIALGQTLTLIAGLGYILVLSWCGFRQVAYWRNSETLWRRAIAATGDYHAYRGLGHFFLNQGRLKEAIEQFQSALRIKPAYPDAHLNMAVALEGIGNLSDAIFHLRQAIIGRPNYPEAYCRLGNDLLATGKPWEAIDQYANAIAHRPHYPEAHFNLGMVLAQQGDIDDALVEYQRAIDDNPTYAEAHYALGNVSFQKGRIDEAIANYRQALKTRPDYPEVENNLAMALLGKGYLHEAIDLWRKNIQFHPNATQTMNNLAWVLATYPDDAVRNGQEAVRLAERARQLAGEHDASTLRTLAAAYAENGQFDRAIAMAENARKIAEAQGNAALSDILVSDISGYRARTPVRTPPRAAD